MLRNDLEYVFGNVPAKLGIIDALTISFRSVDSGEIMHGLSQVVRTLRNRGFVSRDWYGNGYRGWRLGSLRYGIGVENPDYSLLMVAGDVTAMVADLCHKGGKPTRIDFAQDFMYPKPNNWIRDALESHWVIYDTEPEQNYASNLHHSRNGGMTYSRGQRGGEMFLRVYDKGAERNLGRDWWWRYELEVKGPRAVDGYSKWLAAEDRTAFCSGVVERYLRQRSIPHPSNLGQLIEEVRLSRMTVKDNELERKLMFLTKTVKPFLTKLRNYITVREIVDLLDLDVEAFSYGSK